MPHRWGRMRNEEIAKQIATGNVNVANIRWPGNGPWSSLPPWMRPGWQGGGRGRCWYYYLQYLANE